MQEQTEEKCFGQIPLEYWENLKIIQQHPEQVIAIIQQIQKHGHLPFLATDRNVINLPGVGKSMNFRVIGITRHGQRILEFDYDHSRAHSPIIQKLGRIILVESKSISQYCRELEAMGENPADYQNIYGYSLGITTPRMPIYEYPPQTQQITSTITNFQIPRE